MKGRPHKDRLIHELEETRAELAGEVGRIAPEEFDWAPAPEMKSYRAVLLEIGAMERLCAHWLAHQAVLDWKETEDALRAAGPTPAAMLIAMGKIHEETLETLRGFDEERLQTPMALPAEWHQYWGPEVEPEEVFRWIGRHEYYHLGQIITYRWMQGDNPYLRG